MSGAIMVILFNFAVWAHKFGTRQLAHAQDSMTTSVDESIDMLVDRTLQARPVEHADLESTTLGKRGPWYPFAPLLRSYMAIAGMAVVSTVTAEAAAATPEKAPVPSIIYGCAWKKQATEELVALALQNGFRGIDVACQPKHYNEPGVGKALAQMYEDKSLKREDIFLQTKFTSVDGQDPNSIPYDENAELEEQVRQSVAISLRNLQTDYLDSLIMHGPEATLNDTMRVWRVFEDFYDKGIVRFIGMANCYDPGFFSRFYEMARVKPSFLQNRFCEDTDFDVALREVCSQKRVRYQSFWTLTANEKFLESNTISLICNRYQKTAPEIFFAFTRALGIIPLSGTTNKKHMTQDVEITNGSFKLKNDEVADIKKNLFGWNTKLPGDEAWSRIRSDAVDSDMWKHFK